MTLQDITHQPEQCYTIMDKDWVEELQYLLPVFTGYFQIKGYFSGDSLLACGIIFEKPTPVTGEYAEKSQKLFDQGYAYLGYIVVKKENRSQGLGKLWLELLFQLYPNRHFWLAIEDPSLQKFYEKTGFKVLFEHIYSDGKIDKIMIRPYREL